MVSHANARERWLQATWRGTRGALLLLALLLLALLAVPLPARAQEEEQARAAFQQGVEELRAGRWLEARAALLRSLSLVERPSTLYNLALCELKLGLSREALQHLAAFEKLAPTERPELWERAARLRLRAELTAGQLAVQAGGSEPIAVAELEAAQREDLAAGQRAYARGQDALALEAFEAAYHDSGRSELLFNVGLAADRLRFDERALRAYETFVATLPDLPQATHARARIALLRASLSARAATSAASAARAPSALIERSASPRSHGALGDTPTLVAPRALLISGALASAGVVAAGFWWRGRAHAIHTCDENRLCDNGGELERQRRGAIVTTLGLGTLALGLITSGALWLARGKRALAAEGTAPTTRTALRPSLVLSF